MGRPPSRVDRIFRALMRVLPAEFRFDHGLEMAQVFRDEHRDTAAEGRLGRLRLWLRTVAGFVRLAPGAHAATLRRDAAYAVRTMRRSPAFTAIAVGTLALAIGASTMMFSVVDAVLLRPLPYDEGSRLVAIHEGSLKHPGDSFEVSYPTFLDFREASRTIESCAAFRFNEIVLRGGVEPVREFAALVSPELFAALRVRPLLGRAFTADDNRPGTRAMIISYGLWQQLLGGDPDLDGRALTIGQTPVTVVGVMPAGFGFPDQDTNIWLPIGGLGDQPAMRDRAVHMTGVIGRLRDGVTLAQARAELANLAATTVDPGHTATAVPLADDLVGRSGSALVAGSAAVGLVLLLACVNSAGLLLARASSRRRETQIRSALGASRGRLIRQHLTESLMLALIGAALGAALAASGLALVRDTLAEIVPRADAVTLNGRALLFALVTAFVTSAIVGIVPALAGSRADASDGLKNGRFGSRQSVRLRGALVVAEISLSLVLIVGAGLMAKSYWRILNVNPGFEPAGLVSMRITLPSAHYPDDASVVRFYRDLPEQLGGIPGVVTVSGVNVTPISGGDSHGVITAEGQVLAPGDGPVASFRRILPNYFRAMGVPLEAGREFDERDQGQEPLVVIISRAMARRLWPDASPLGRRIKIGPADREPWLTVVGVVGDVRNVGRESAPAFDTYEPHAQRPWSTMQALVRTHGDAARVGADARTVLRRLDADLIVDRVETMDARIASAELARRFSTWLLAAFAGVALALAAVSLYGLTSYTVTERTREFGVRIALGAERRDIAWLVVGRSLRLGVAGVTIGIFAAVPAARAARAFFVDVGPLDPGVYLGVGIVLLAVALASPYLPARRATHVDPNVTLRVD